VGKGLFRYAPEPLPHEIPNNFIPIHWPTLAPLYWPTFAPALTPALMPSLPYATDSFVHVER
jgi:hypothetical protein